MRLVVASVAVFRSVMKAAPVGVVALLVALSTSPATTACTSCTINPSDFDQSCTEDSDCVGIASGDLCSKDCTNCVNAAINVRSEKQYQDEFSSRVGKESICPCALAVTGCNSGTCGLVDNPPASQVHPLDSGLSD
jgi:hypothetical protein